MVAKRQSYVHTASHAMFLGPHGFVYICLHFVMRRDSAKCHIFGSCASRRGAGLRPKIWTSPRFLFDPSSPKFHHPMFTHSEIIVLTNKQTNRRCQKHPTFFATLRCWVMINDKITDPDASIVQRKCQWFPLLSRIVDSHHNTAV